MRSALLVVLSLFLGAAIPRPSEAGDKRAAGTKPAVVVLPFEGAEQAIGELSVAGALVAIGALEAGDELNLLHLKQLNRTLEYHAPDLRSLSGSKRTERIAAWLGADWVLSGTVKSEPKKVEIVLTISDPKGTRAASSTIKGDEMMAALGEVPQHTRALLSKVGVKLAPTPARPATPLTKSLPALLEYAACYAVLIRQPIGIRDPVLLQTEVVNEAIGRCDAALKADPSFADPRAALGLAYALKGDQKQAEQNLASVKDSAAFLPLYSLGKFWVLSRYYDANLAAEMLQKVLGEHPGFLLARGYLGDTYNKIDRSKDALAVFQGYLEILPSNPWVLSRIGYTYSKLGDHTQALEWTNKALRLTPSDSEILLEMSGRLVDAGRNDDALAILKRIVADGSARGEVHLRIGYILILLKKYAAAEQELVRAIETSTALGEWRTRGRARYDLAKLWMKQGAPDNAIRQLQSAIDEGYRDTDKFAVDPDMKPLLDNPRYQAMIQKVSRSGPEYIAPFVVNAASGDIAAAEQPKKALAIQF